MSSDTEPHAPGTPRWLPGLLALILLFVGYAVLPAADTFAERKPTLDELGWLAISHDTYTAFQKGDLAEVEWKEGLQKTTYGAMNPNLAKLLFGRHLAAQGYDLEPPRVFPALYPDARGRMKNPKFLDNRAGRHAPFLESLRDLNVWLMAAAAAFLFLATSLVCNPGAGLVAWGLFVSTPEIREQTAVVMTDNLLLVLLGAGLVASQIALVRCSRSAGQVAPRLMAMAGVGLLLGLAPSTKLNGALSCIAFGVAVLGMLAARRFPQVPRWQPLVWAGLAGAWAIGVFLALYPFLWNGVGEGLDYIFERWDKLLGSQTQSFNHLALLSPFEKIRAAYYPGVLGIGPDFLPTLLLACLFGIAFLYLSLAAVRSLLVATNSPVVWVTWVFAVVWLVATTAWIPLDWARYYLPMQWFSCLIVAVPFGLLLGALKTRLLARRAPSTNMATATLLCGVVLPLGACGGEESAASDDAASAVRAPIEPPHILLLTVDTLRADVLGMYGYDRDTSPYLDSLLADAFHFPHTVSTVPRTTPALASLLTGAYPHTTGVRVLMHALRDEVTPITEVLKADGYGTIAVVTNQMLGKERMLSRGFDTYLPAKDTRDAHATTDVVLELLEAHDFTRPLFLWTHYIDPHMPYVSDPAIIQEFDPGYEGRYALNFGQFPDRTKPGPRRGGPYPPDLPKAIAVHRNPLPEEVNAHIRRLYAADVRSTDAQIRRLVEGLREKTGGNLLIVFTSDHGESLGEHDFYWDHGDYVYNAASRVPFAILLPEGHPDAGKGSYDPWVSGVDMVPTLFDLLGKPIPESMTAQMEGRSLAPAMRGEAMDEEAVFIESGRSHFFKFVRGRADNTTAGKFRAVIDGDWKLIWAPGHEDKNLSWQLYDLAADPHETVDLFSYDHPHFERLVELLQPWVAKSVGGTEEEAISEADRAFLQELGYVGEDGE